MMVSALARKGRRRFVWNEILAQSTNAVSGALAGLILLLLIGTQILDWRWLVLLPVITLAAGCYRISRRLPPLYALAQSIDQRLKLADTLSTALFFSDPRHAGKTSGPMRDAQLAEAERVSKTISVKQALPFTMPRAIYAVTVLGVIASSLFALRYLLDRRLDLRPPLAQILHDTFAGTPLRQAALQPKKGQRGPKPPDLQDTLGMSLPDGEQKSPGQLDAAPDSALDTVGVPDVDNDKAGPQPGGKSQGQTPGSEKSEGEQSGMAGEENKSSSGGDGPSEGQQGSAASKKGEASSGEQPSAGSGENSSLMSKLRDAMSNLLSRMKQPPVGSGQQQASNSGSNGKKQASGEQGKPGDGRQQSGNQNGSDSQDGQQQGGDAQNAQNAQGQGSGQSADQQASKQPGSGIGKQDGSKDVKLAEQVAAMGKLSEIIGKRSANVTGEVTVEVQSNNQQLRTPYSKNSAEHTESGGEISRDEVPVIYQSYVQQYFEQVRKGAGNAQPVPGARRP